MKILYLTPIAKKQGSKVNGENRIYDFDSISKTISDGIKNSFPDCEITMIAELFTENETIDENVLSKYDVAICDLTTGNCNVVYFAGKLEVLKKPIIYFHSSDTSFPVAFMTKRKISYSEASLENDFREEIKESIILAKENPSSLLEVLSEELKKPKAFLSYSHQDKKYFDRLMVHLKPLVKKGWIDIWADTKLTTGDQWKKEIEKALDDSSIAILMVSADFLASDFIINNELPPLLSKAEVHGTRILPVILTPCRFSREPTLSRFQAANAPSEPLSSLTNDEREKIYDNLAYDIEKSLENV